MLVFKLIFGIIGGVIGCYIALYVSAVLLGIHEVLPVRIAMFIGIVLFSSLFVYIFSKLEKTKHFNKFIFIFSTLLFVFGFTLLLQSMK